MSEAASRVTTSPGGMALMVRLIPDAVIAAVSRVRLTGALRLAGMAEAVRAAVDRMISVAGGAAVTVSGMPAAVAWAVASVRA